VTIKELLAQAVQQRPEAVAIRFKKHDQWNTISYNKLMESAQRVSEALAQLGIKRGDRVAIFRENSPEWAEIYFGIVGLAATAVPIDAKLQEQEVAHILRDSGARALFAGVKEYPLLAEIEPRLPALAHILLIDGHRIQPGPSRKAKYWDYEDTLQETSETAQSECRAYDKQQPNDDDIASFIYTSGTTGRQKGAMLTHLNFTADVESMVKAIRIYPEDNFMLVLPLHHAFAFTTNLLVPLRACAQISLVENLKTIGENIREVSPTILIGVPLLLEKMYNRMWTGLKDNKLAYFLYKMNLRAPVVRGIRNKMGGSLRMLISGGAPCDSDLLVNLERLGLPILEGYGLTEAAPVLTLNPQEAPRPGTVGKPLPNIEIKIMDPNDEGIGEIAAQGANIMKGYFNNPEATASALHDGWLLTGDLGKIEPDGYLIITGRKKSLIVNREGKNIYPEEVEHQICKSLYVREALVVGYREDSEKVGEYVGIIVVPNQEAIDAVHKKHDLPLSEPEIADLIRKEIKRLSAEIAEYKRPRRIKIRWEEFAKTSTGKVKRYLYVMGDREEGC